MLDRMHATLRAMACGALTLLALAACAGPSRAVGAGEVGEGGGSGGGRASGESASRLTAVEGEYGAPRIAATRSVPPQFVLVFERQTPTPGYTLRQDAVEIDAERGRIVARVSEVPPGGMVAQVISEAELRLNLGAVPTGRWVLEIHARRGDAGEYRLQQALVLVAN